MMAKLPIVGVMGSGTDMHRDLSHPLGELIASKAVHLLTGGGQGAMNAVGQAFTSSENRKGLHLGVIPTEKGAAKAGYPNDYVEISILTPLEVFDGIDPDQISRNHVNIMTSDMIIALPGSKGTINEVKIAQKLDKPLIYFGESNLFSQFPTDPELTSDLNVINRFIDNHLTSG